MKNNKDFLMEHIITDENPYKELWDLLSLNLIKTHLESASSFSFSSGRIEQIKTLYKQSRELFEAARTTTILSSPLLDFYSFTKLAKILIMVKQNLDISSLDQSHGLKVKFDDKNLNIDDLEIIFTKKGTFPQLFKSLTRYDEPVLKSRATIKLGELLNFNIATYQYQQIISKCIPVFEHRIENKESGRRIEIRLIGKADKSTFEDLKQRHPDFPFGEFTTQNIIMTSRKGYPIFRELSDGERPDYDVEKDYKSQTFLVPPMNISGKSIILYQHEIQFLIAFVASNLVRYYPMSWQNIVNDEAVFWSLRKALGLARRTFLNQILDLISMQRHFVLPPGTTSWNNNS